MYFFFGTFGEEKNSQVSEVTKFDLGCMNAKRFKKTLLIEIYINHKAIKLVFITGHNEAVICVPFGIMCHASDFLFGFCFR